MRLIVTNYLSKNLPKEFEVDRIEFWENIRFIVEKWDIGYGSPQCNTINTIRSTWKNATTAYLLKYDNNLVNWIIPNKIMSLANFYLYSTKASEHHPISAHRHHHFVPYAQENSTVSSTLRSVENKFKISST